MLTGEAKKLKPELTDSFDATLSKMSFKWGQPSKAISFDSNLHRGQGIDEGFAVGGGGGSSSSGGGGGGRVGGGFRLDILKDRHKVSALRPKLWEQMDPMLQEAKTAVAKQLKTCGNLCRGLGATPTTHEVYKTLTLELV